jgi:hypothetical protein
LIYIHIYNEYTVFCSHILKDIRCESAESAPQSVVAEKPSSHNVIFFLLFSECIIYLFLLSVSSMYFWGVGKSKEDTGAKEIGLWE